MGREKHYLTNNKLKISLYMKILGRLSLLLKSSSICFMLIGFSQGDGLCQTTTFTKLSLWRLCFYQSIKEIPAKIPIFRGKGIQSSIMWLQSSVMIKGHNGQIWYNLSPFLKKADEVFSTPVLETELNQVFHTFGKHFSTELLPWPFIIQTYTTQSA